MARKRMPQNSAPKSNPEPSVDPKKEREKRREQKKLEKKQHAEVMRAVDAARRAGIVQACIKTPVDAHCIPVDTLPFVMTELGHKLRLNHEDLVRWIKYDGIIGKPPLSSTPMPELSALLSADIRVAPAGCE